MMRPELIWDAFCFAASPELVRVVFDLRAAIWKDQVITSAQMTI